MLPARKVPVLYYNAKNAIVANGKGGRMNRDPPVTRHQEEDHINADHGLGDIATD